MKYTIRRATDQIRSTGRRSAISDDGGLADPSDSAPGGCGKSLQQATPLDSAGGRSQAEKSGGERRGAEVPERVDWG